MIVLKIDIIDDNELIIYLYNSIYRVDYKDEKKLEEMLRNLFVKLRKYYDIKIEGYYDVFVYIDYIYGMVLDLRRQGLEYYDFFDNQVDMKIMINKNRFLYLVDDYDIDLNKYRVYKLMNNIYLLPKKVLSNYELGRLVENSKIIYDSEEIINKGIKI